MLLMNLKLFEMIVVNVKRNLFKMIVVNVKRNLVCTLFGNSILLTFLMFLSLVVYSYVRDILVTYTTSKVYHQFLETLV